MESTKMGWTSAVGSPQADVQRPGPPIDATGPASRATWYPRQTMGNLATDIHAEPQNPVRVLLLRELATGPVAAAFVAERWTHHGSNLAVVKVLRDATPPERIFPLCERSGALGALRHRHIVTADQLVSIDGHYGVMSPYVDGIDLLEWMDVLREEGVRFPPRVVCEMLRAVAVALDTALHRTPWGEDGPLALPHGDLKPGNIMVDRDGELKVLDFGMGASQLAMEPLPPIRSATAYVAPEHPSSGPTAEADIYALGIIGIELLADRWLQSFGSTQDDHDLKLGQIARRLEFTMRSEADEQTLRSLLLRMTSFDPSRRPRAAVVAQTLRRLADRAPGPSLESFAHERALPHLVNVPENPDTGMMVQVMLVWNDRSLVSPREGPEPDADTNTMSAGDFRRLVEDDITASAFLVDSRNWGRIEISLTDQVADETEKAIDAARRARTLDFSIEEGLFEDDIPTEGREVQPRDEVPEVVPDLVVEPPVVRRRSPWRWVIAAVVTAMLLGACIALAATLIGLAVGLYLAITL